MVTVYLLEPHPDRLQTLTQGLAQLPHLTVIGAGATYADLFQVLQKPSPPQALLVNLDLLPIELATWGPLRTWVPDLTVVGLLSDQDPQQVMAALALGAVALLKPEALVATIGQALLLGQAGTRGQDPQLLQVARFWAQRALAQTTNPAPDLTLDLAQENVQRGDQTIALNPLEFKVLACLSAQPDTVLSPAALLEQVWLCPQPDGGTQAQVKCCIQRLRGKLEFDRTQPHYIQTVWGRGYRLGVTPRVKNGKDPAHRPQTSKN